MTDKIHSTGRGGAGNIGADTNTYVDGDIVREGTPQEGGEYRGGRGGAGNTAHSTAPKPVSSSGTPLPTSEDVIPEPAFRSAEGYDNFHTGRGGQGNVHRAEFGGHSNAQLKHEGEHKPEGILEKAKHAIGLDKKDKA
ncbi:hypothetical protein AMS68_001920 [Peltaster fructicola]|uniref:Uncharacterized protein n=1 Tax=Peltaster fructicola TaxID=286661 RepID=A0A6H0XNW1_9PEZI|nr:hypothetical protein AMS68_001920 [Peltaster fructicola]